MAVLPIRHVLNRAHHLVILMMKNVHFFVLISQSQYLITKSDCLMYCNTDDKCRVIERAHTQIHSNMFYFTRIIVFQFQINDKALQKKRTNNTVGAKLLIFIVFKLFTKEKVKSELKGHIEIKRKRERERCTLA